MINKFVDLNSFIGTTSSGFTFSEQGVIVNGVSGMSVVLGNNEISGNLSYLGDLTPFILVNTSNIGFGTNYGLPSDPTNGTTISIRRSDTSGSGTTGLYAPSFRMLNDDTNDESGYIYLVSHTPYRFFYYMVPGELYGTWYQF